MNLSKSEKVILAVCAAMFLTGIVLLYISNTIHTPVNITVTETPEDDYPVDVINSATLEDFMAVPGVGEVKAGNIIEFREALGGFRKVSQLKYVSGISDGLYQKIIEHFYTDPPEDPDQPSETTAAATAVPDVTSENIIPEDIVTAATDTEKITSSEKPAESESASDTLKTVDINSADRETIMSSLMISEELADKIVQLREIIGGYSTAEELFLIDGMDKNTYQRIKEFIVIG